MAASGMVTRIVAISLYQRQTQISGLINNANTERDKRNIETLKKLVWNVIFVWECELKPKVVEKNLNGLVTKLFMDNCFKNPSE